MIIPSVVMWLTVIVFVTIFAFGLGYFVGQESQRKFYRQINSWRKG